MRNNEMAVKAEAQGEAVKRCGNCGGYMGVCGCCIRDSSPHCGEGVSAKSGHCDQWGPEV